MGLIPKRRVVVAPRGELSLGALSIKKWRKQLYLRQVRWFRLVADAQWHATSAGEVLEIRSVFGDGAPVTLAPNFANPGPARDSQRLPKESGALRIVFLSRISAKKNLLFALRILGGLADDVTFDLYGPIEDDAYWTLCLRQMALLPSNVRVRYGGPVTPDRVTSVLQQYDLFFLPTLGENHGHAIAEALSAGCPVLISDQTPWRNLARLNAGWDISLAQEDLFREVIRKCASMSTQQHGVWSDGARSLSVVRARESDARVSHASLFTLSIGRSTALTDG